jgi:hypothetical protein
VSIRELKRGPDTELPAARLFLEDLEAIVGILLDTFRSGGGKYPYDEEPTVRFQLEGKECDSIEDLRRLGGRSRDFRVSVGTRGACFVHISEYSSQWYVIGSKEKQWTVRGELESVFKKRSKRLERLSASLLLIALLLAIGVLGAVASRPMFFLSVLIVAGLVGFSGVPALWSRWAGSTVIFRYSYDSVSLGERINKAWGFVLAALLGGLLTALGAHLAHKLWP